MKKIVKKLFILTFVFSLMFSSGCKNNNIESEIFSPNITPVQKKRISLDIANTINSGFSEHNIPKIDSRTSSKQNRMMRSQLNLIDINEQIKGNTKMSSSIIGFASTTNDSWPRYGLNIIKQNNNNDTPKIYMLIQKDQYSLYKIWGLVRMFSNVSIPVIGNITSLVEKNDKTFKVSPTNALKNYFDVLEKGDKSKYAKTYQKDQLRTFLQKQDENDASALKYIKGSQKHHYNFTGKDLLAMRLKDDGYIVMGFCDSDTERISGNGMYAKPIDKAEEKLFGDAQPSTKIRTSYINLVAIFVPNKGSKNKIQVIGAERIPFKVSPF